MTTNNHWYVIDNSGMATLCVDEQDARDSAVEYAELYPKRAPYVVGQIQPAMPADAEDAERYRLLRRGQHWSVVDGIGDTLRADALDAAIDARHRTEGES